MRVFHRDDEQIRVRVGERFIIELEADTALGYEWSLHPGKLTRVVSEELRASARVGSVRFRFVLEATRAGTESIVAAYGRSGQPKLTGGMWFKVDISDSRGVCR